MHVQCMYMCSVCACAVYVHVQCMCMCGVCICAVYVHVRCMYMCSVCTCAVVYNSPFSIRSLLPPPPTHTPHTHPTVLYAAGLLPPLPVNARADGQGDVELHADSSHAEGPDLQRKGQLHLPQQLHTLVHILTYL